MTRLTLPRRHPRLIFASRARWLEFGDSLFHSATLLAALVVPLLSLLLIVFLVIDSWATIQRLGFSFFLHSRWDTNRIDFGALGFVYGTLATSALAMLIAVPISVAAAAFLAEIAPNWLRRLATSLTELLAAIPSVVYGFWGILFLVPIMQAFYRVLHIPNTTGRGILSASIILAVMIVPYIAAITYDVCRAVPTSQRDGALALGSTRWQMIWLVVLPYARSGIIGASFLALGRALGETMAVAMLIGNSTRLDWSIFGLGSSIPSVIANELGSASRAMHKSALIELGLVLFFVTVIVNTLARLLIWRVGQSQSNQFAFWQRKIVPHSVSVEATSSLPLPPVKVRPDTARRQRTAWTDQWMTWLLAACLGITLLPLFHIFGYIAFKGIQSLDWQFFTHLPIDTTPGLGHALLGSTIMVGLATIAAVPIGLLAALYLTEYRRSRIVPGIRFVAELLGGVPSIVVGLFAYALLVQPFGFSAWAGSFALLVLMIPIVVRASEEALKLVPGSLRNASLALGASRSQTVLRVVVPSAIPGIITGVFLAIARIAGETAPLLFTAYSSNFWPRSLGQRTPFLTFFIYNYSLSDVPEEQRQALAGALVLLVVVMILNFSLRVLTGKRAFAARQAD